jgi:hypothetical protein
MKKMSCNHEEENVYPVLLTLEDKIPNLNIDVYDPKTD